MAERRARRRPASPTRRSSSAAPTRSAARPRPTRASRSGAKARFEAENAKGGIDGRKIEFVTLDDGYEPQRAVTNVRRLVEQDKVFALFNTLGTPNNLAIWDYANQKKVPHLFVATGASNWGADIDAHPYTTGWQPDYVSEAKTYAEFLKTEKPTRRSPCSTRTTASARTCSAASRRRSMGSNIQVVAQRELRGDRPDDHVADAQARRPPARDTFLNITTPKFSAQAIAAIAKSDWKPLHILNNVGASKKLVLSRSGLENAKDIVSMSYFKDPEDPQWADDAAMQEYKAGLKKFEPKADPLDAFCAYGWAAASTMIEALKAMKEPTREALMEAVRNMDIEIPMLLPGVKVTINGETDGYPIQATQIMKFNGENWELQGDVIEAGT